MMGSSKFSCPGYFEVPRVRNMEWLAPCQWSGNGTPSVESYKACLSPKKHKPRHKRTFQARRASWARTAVHCHSEGLNLRSGRLAWGSPGSPLASWVSEQWLLLSGPGSLCLRHQGQVRSLRSFWQSCFQTPQRTECHTYNNISDSKMENYILVTCSHYDRKIESINLYYKFT